MKSPDYANFATLLIELGVIYEKPMNQTLIEVYWCNLKQFDFIAVKKALQAHVVNPDPSGRYMPKPSDIVRYLKGSSHTQALQAWSRVIKAISDIGCYSSVIFDDALVHAVISDMGGWVQLCKVKENELPFRANEFEKRYTGYVLHPPTTYPKKLTGIIEQQNHETSYNIASPILIGDRQKALLVYKGGEVASLLYYQPNVPLEQLIEQPATLTFNQPNQEEKNDEHC